VYTVATQNSDSRIGRKKDWIFHSKGCEHMNIYTFMHIHTVANSIPFLACISVYKLTCMLGKVQCTRLNSATHA